MVKLPSSWKVAAFTVNLIVGLCLSQGIGAVVDKHTFEAWSEIVQVLTMWCLSFIMINVGFEFTLDKNNLTEYGRDYLIAMTAAGFPWVFVAVWFFVAVGDLPFSEALLIARFAAPTSAGILFSMLEGAGLKDTWLFSKARILAIFDDLDTILLMIPLKVILVGFKWELLVVVLIMIALLLLAWTQLHNVALPHGWHWTLLYAAVVSVVCKILHHFTHHSHDMEAIHIEVLLPAFVIGCIIDTPSARHELKLQRRASDIRKVVRSSSKESAGSGGSSRTGGTERDTSKVSPNFQRASSKGSHASNQSSISVVEESAPPGCVIEGSNLVTITESVKPMNHLQAAKLINQPIAEQANENPESLKASLEQLEPVGEVQATPLSKQELNSLRSAAWVEAPIDKEDEHVPSSADQKVQTVISLVFMVLVGLSMPLLVGPHAEDNGGDMSPLMIVVHIVLISILMILGKMFPIFCYSDEADIKTRLALCLGMCPRGEVGAAIIVISLELDVKGPAVLIAMGALVVNLVLSSGFIASVKLLLRSSASREAAAASKLKLSDMECIE